MKLYRLKHKVPLRIQIITLKISYPGANINTDISIITLNVNWFNSQVKRHSMTEWDEETKSNYLLST